MGLLQSEHFPEECVAAATPLECLSAGSTRRNNEHHIRAVLAEARHEMESFALSVKKSVEYSAAPREAARKADPFSFFVSGQNQASVSTAPIVNKRVRITKGNPETDLWLHGHLTKRPDYTFVAKVFDVGSIYGIENGRVSKLEMRTMAKWWSTTSVAGI
jgi:hypothetical protein